MIFHSNSGYVNTLQYLWYVHCLSRLHCLSSVPNFPIYAVFLQRHRCPLSRGLFGSRSLFRSFGEEESSICHYYGLQSKGSLSIEVSVFWCIKITGCIVRTGRVLCRGVYQFLTPSCNFQPSFHPPSASSPRAWSVTWRIRLKGREERIKSLRKGIKMSGIQK